MSEKVYVGRGKVVGQYGSIKIGVRVADLEEHKNERGYIDLMITEMRNPDEWGNTHSVFVSQRFNSQNNEVSQRQPNINESDLPF